MTPHTIEISGNLDAQTDLLDRQIVSSDGALIAKVDDIEVEQTQDGLIVTGLLVGPGALGPRLGGAISTVLVGTWSRLARREPDQPRRIDYTHVAGIATVIAVDHARRSIQIDGLETWTRVNIIDALPGAGHDPDAGDTDGAPDLLEEGPPAAGERHRITRLTGMRVIFAGGQAGDLVNDVRFSKVHRRGHLPALVVDGLIIGRNRPGTLFGYDRNRQNGPWLVQQILRRVHRHTGFVAWTDVADVDWTSRTVTLRTDDLQSIDAL